MDLVSGSPQAVAPVPIADATRRPVGAYPITRSVDHRYTFDGMTHPGVTSILGILDKSGPLMAWAARQTAEAALDLNLVETLAAVGREGTIKALTSRSSWKRDEAAQLGTDVHRIAEDLIHGRMIAKDVPDHALAHVTAYTDWLGVCKWRPRLTEAMVVHPLAGYGGTFDLLAYDADGRTVLADIKTGKGVYKEAALQLAAYGMALLVQPQNVAKTYPMPEIDRYVILHVTADGVREVEMSIGSMEQAAFLACIDLYRWAETMKGKKL